MSNQGEKKPFYVGVTYCGSSVEEAIELVDKVKACTNLFVLQPGAFQRNMTAMDEIGDYVISVGLNYAISGGIGNEVLKESYLNDAKKRWGEQFIGIYYSDEPGGKMLDSTVTLGQTTVRDSDTATSTSDTIVKEKDGGITFHDIYSKNMYTFYSNGKISVYKGSQTEITKQEASTSAEENQFINGTIIGSYKTLYESLEYYPDGKIIIEVGIDEGIIQQLLREFDTFSEICDYQISEKYVTNLYTSENITKYPSQIQTYEQILKLNPIKNKDDAADAFINRTKGILEGDYFGSHSGCLNRTKIDESIVFFTADYGLYWWDYKSGYDLVLAELGWNNSIAQEIGLVRGAANLHGKSWGTISTWKYTHAPYLPDGKEMFEQMKTSYQAGAEYVLIFNFSEDKEKPNTLQEEHFQALERFWKNVVQSSKVKHGGIKTEAVVVLPHNYGWGMRHPQDSIWGIWPADDTSQQIWSQLQNKIDKHGLKLDIVYEDPNYPVVDYKNVYYWQDFFDLVR
jgi:hypothetical protein